MQFNTYHDSHHCLMSRALTKHTGSISCHLETQACYLPSLPLHAAAPAMSCHTTVKPDLLSPK